ncbi:MAG: DUF4251 domain-containing protein [Cyclobacteriaceae bacterium]|nr:DUF4251 domain-containing protein [Cyclobacteriaceae bacterium]
MKKLILSIAMLGILVPGFGQNNSMDTLTRKERKELRKQQSIENKKVLEKSLANRTWVLEAHTVSDRYGNTVQTSPSTNFILVDGEQAVIQLAFPHFIGYNGLGGITFDDQLGNYQIKPGKKENSGINLSMDVHGVNIGNASVMLSTSADGNARATVSGPWGWRITYSGNLVPLEESSIFTGRSRF